MKRSVPYATNFEEFVDIIATESPHAAILEWWRRLDRSIDYYFEQRGVPRPSRTEAVRCVLAEDPQLGEAAASLLDRLRRFRNQVAHDELGPLAKGQAVQFARDAFQLIGCLAWDQPFAH